MENDKITTNEYINHLSGALDCNCCMFQIDDTCLPAFCQHSCNLQGISCNCHNTHLYGSYEADRWRGRYIYYCPLGLIFISASFGGKDKHSKTYAVAGPILMNEPEDIDLDLSLIENEWLPPKMSTTRVNDIAEIMTITARYFSETRAVLDIQQDKEQSSRHNTLYDLSSQMREDSDNSYPITCERELMTHISRGDKSGSQEMLNKLLGHIYFFSGADLQLIKARVTELIVLLSRASIEGGADINKIFWLNTSYMKDVQNFTNLEDLSEWLSEIMHRFISYVFDFKEIKHVDVIFKVLEYVRQHYSEKLTLEDVASHVYLSKSYLSKIFKEEMDCTFTGYVNQIRVEKSKQILLSDNIDILDVAMIVGFDDQSYFTKVFKKNVGISPGKFRENRGVK